MNWAMKERDYSQRRACALVGMAPKTYRYVSAKPDDAMLRSKLREMAHERRRFGYRRLHLLLRRAGVEINHKKLFRLYREERLTVRRRGGRKRAIGTRAPMAIPQGPNQRWSVDFLHDVLADGRRFRIFAVVDDFTRECLTLTIDTSISGGRVVRELGRITELRGCPCMIVSDNGMSSPRTPCSPGPTKPPSTGIISRQESRCRTPSSRASTAGSGTNA